jgi:hypothetical protein
MPTQVVEELRQKSRRYARFVFAAGVILVLLTVASRMFFGSPRSWTSWAIPLLITANAGVMLVPNADRYPRAISAYHWLSIAAAVAIIAALVLQS